MRKGIILAGGSGTRLYPLTLAMPKALMAVYDTPMVYHSLSVLMMAGIRDILLICAPRDHAAFQALLGDGAHLGIAIRHAVQPHPGGIAQAYHVGADFVGEAPSALVLGDNIFHGAGLPALLAKADARSEGATVFGYHVSDPGAYGVVSFDEAGKACTIEEKPRHPRSHCAVTGLYFYDGRAVQRARELQPGVRGELEITDLNRRYLEEGELNVEMMGPGYTWLDAGTHGSLLDAGTFVRIIEQRQRRKIACPEEIAWRLSYITDRQLERLAHPLIESGYGSYLLGLLRDRAQETEMLAWN